MFKRKNLTTSFMLPAVIVNARPKKSTNDDNDDKDDSDALFSGTDDIEFDGLDEDLANFEETQNPDDEY